jgi:hypothetical protein
MTREACDLRRRSQLEYKIGLAMQGLLPWELKRLAALLTEPQLRIAQRLRALVRDVAMGREGNER